MYPGADSNFGFHCSPLVIGDVWERSSWRAFCAWSSATTSPLHQFAGALWAAGRTPTKTLPGTTRSWRSSHTVRATTTTTTSLRILPQRCPLVAVGSHQVAHRRIAVRGPDEPPQEDGPSRFSALCWPCSSPVPGKARQAAQAAGHSHIEQLRQRIAHEYETFLAALSNGARQRAVARREEARCSRALGALEIHSVCKRSKRACDPAPPDAVDQRSARVNPFTRTSRRGNSASDPTPKAARRPPTPSTTSEAAQRSASGHGRDPRPADRTQPSQQTHRRTVLCVSSFSIGTVTVLRAPFTPWTHIRSQKTHDVRRGTGLRSNSPIAKDITMAVKQRARPSSNHALRG